MVGVHRAREDGRLGRPAVDRHPRSKPVDYEYVRV